MRYYENADRPETVKALKEELVVLMDYLPQQLSEGEIRRLVRETIAIVGAQGPKDLGKVMGALSPKTKGRADGKFVNLIVREILGA